MSYNRGSGYYTSRYGSGGPPKKYGSNNASYNDNNPNASGQGQATNSGSGSSSNPGSAPGSASGNPSQGDKNRAGAGAYSGRRAERDYYGGYRSRYDNKYNKYAGGSGPNGPNSNAASSNGPAGTGSGRNASSTYYGSASTNPSSSNPPYKRRPTTDRYDSYTGGAGPKYYSSSVSSNGIEESNPKTTYSKYPSSSSRSPEWKSSAALKPGREDSYKPAKSNPNTISTNKFSDERRGKSTIFKTEKSKDSSVPSESSRQEKRNSDTPKVDPKMTNFFDDENEGGDELKRRTSDGYKSERSRRESNDFVKSKSVDIEKVRRNSRTEDEWRKAERRKSISSPGAHKSSKFPSESQPKTESTDIYTSTENSKPKEETLKKEIESKPTETKPNEPNQNQSKPNESEVEESKTTESKPIESKPIESKPIESTPIEPKSVESKSVETKPVETKPVETKPAETKPAETKPVETKPAEIKPVESKQAGSAQEKAASNEPKIIEPAKADAPKAVESKPKPKENKTSFSDYLKSSKEKKIYVHSSVPKEVITQPKEEKPIVPEDKEELQTKQPKENDKHEKEKDVTMSISLDEKPEVNDENEIADETEMQDDKQEVAKVESNEEEKPDSVSSNSEKQQSEEPVKEDDKLFVSPASTASESIKSSVRISTDDSGDTSTLSPVRHSASVDNFNFNNLATISELVDREEEPTQNDIDMSEEDNKSDSDNDSSDGSASEAETVITNSPPVLSKARRLIRKKDYDETRHNLKRKAIFQSDDEDANKAYNQSDEQSGDEKRKPFRPYKVKRDSGGRSQLQRACKKGQLDEIKNYLAKGADANEMDYGGFTCLHEAALEGHNEVVKILIEHGAKVNARADAAGDSETPLIDAAENKHLETVKILLEYGADPSIYNIDGFTALTKIYNEHADEEGYEEIIKLLEDANAKFIQRSQRSIKETGTKSASPAPPVLEDPYDTYFGELIKKKGICKFAAEGSKEVTANYFVSGNGLSSKPDILIIAARNGHVELVDIILGLNPTPYNIDTENECGATALLASVGRGHYEVVESLLSKDADPTKKRKQDGLNSLEIAQRSIHFDQKEVDLIQSYVDKNPKREPESRPISVANSAATSTVVSEDENMEIDSEKEEVEDRKRKFQGDHPQSKKLKKSKSESKLRIQTQPSEVFKRLGSPENHLERTKSLEQPSSPQSKKSSHATASPSPSPSPAPTSKAQEELKAKSLEEARIWQEKVEAKKRARRDMFLKSEKEKERKRKEEEEKRIEEEKRLAELREQEKIRLAQEAQEKSKILQQQKKELMQKHTKETYPIGLYKAKFGVQLSEEYILQYAPLYVFDIDGVKYVTDLQVALMTGRPVSEFSDASSKHLTAVEKSKIWELYFYMVGVDKKKPYDNLRNLKTEGYEKFQNLLISFVELNSVKEVLKDKHPLTYGVVWGSVTRCTEVDLEAMNVFRGDQTQTPTLNQRVVSEVDMEVVVDTKTVSETFFVPPKFRRRRDTLRAISTISRPMW